MLKRKIALNANRKSRWSCGSREYGRFWGQEHVAELILGSHLKNVQLLAK